MWTAVPRAAFRLACAVAFALAFLALASAQEPVAPTPQLLASADALSYSASYLVRPIEPAKPKPNRVADTKFIGMSALAMGLTIADIETTQHCLGDGTCRELNPVMPHSRVGMYAVNVPVNALLMYVSYRLKAGGHKTWWIAPIAISSSHAIGAGFVF
jgi:hypothetical protein